jgi:prepilin-type N-terminal cleavage/methylation domain-containing protein
VIFRSHLISKKGFTLVELVIGMTIFAVAMTGILALLHSTISSSLVSRHEIIAANLAREQIELIRNARNTNIRNYTDWDRLRIGDDGSGFLTG